MTLSSKPQSPGPAADTPAPDTATLDAIRAWTHAASGWWTFELRSWHYWTAIAAALVLAAACAVLVAIIGIHR